MTEDEKKIFLQSLVGIAEIYGKTLSESLIRVYWEILKRYDVEDVARSFTQHASNPDAGQFMPKPADIIKCIDGGGDSRSLKAWTKVEKAIRTVGPYQTVVFDDLIIHKVIEDLGGWISLNAITDKELPFKANEFSKRYLGYIMRSNIKYPKKLIGIAEANNVMEKKKVEPPISIGGTKKAEQVYREGISYDSIKIQALPDFTSNIENKLKTQKEL